MDSEDKAPSTSPISMALAVPTAWDALPRATPFEILSFILNSFNICTPNIFPQTPVTVVKAAAKFGNPPMVFAISIEIAAVEDLGNMVIIIRSSIPKALHSTNMVTSPARLPIVIPIMIISHLPFNKFMFLYRGTDNITVAGAIKKLIILPPL